MSLIQRFKELRQRRRQRRADRRSLKEDRRAYQHEYFGAEKARGEAYRTGGPNAP